MFVALVLIFCVSVFPNSPAQNYLTATGSPSFSAPEPVEYGFVESANGNLYLEFPLGSFPQRGSKQPYAVRLVYNSHIWQTFVNTSGNLQWTPKTVGNILMGAGWNYVDPIQGQVSETDYSWTGCGIDVAWTDGAGTTRYFPLPNVYNSGGSSGSSCATSGNAFATDSSGYHLYYTVGNNNIYIYAPDGTIVLQGTWNGPGLGTDAEGNKITGKDPNGNYLSLAPNSSSYPVPVDTLGRTPYLVSNAYQAFDVANSKSSATTQSDPLRSHYALTIANIAVNTAFGQSGVTESGGSNINVVQSIALPDGSSFSFKYDCDSTLNSQACSSPHGQSAYYGVLTQMTLPTGATVYYGYSTFTDSYRNKSRWLTSRTSQNGTWYYTPKVLTTCSSGSVGCQQQLTVTKPSGDTTVYTFRLDNGAWLTQTASYDGGGNLLSATTNTWDFTQSCALHNCTGHGYIRELSELTTMYAPGSSALTKKTQYTYSSPQNGLVTEAQDWKFYPGTSPSFPSIADRTTYVSYYTGGTNNINRPTVVTVCNSSGSDARCPGGGSMVQQTVITYDSYATICNYSGLSLMSGVANHDDTNYGTGYTTRGDATLVQRWVSGSTYVSTQMAYDTTGQVTKMLDANGNCTSYGYGDSFYQDNGANPPLQVAPPSLPTNAYLTQVTFPTVGNVTLTESFGYYLGSGKQAQATDPNVQSSYSHFVDPLDRPTSTQQPISWSQLSYPSPTEVDTLTPVNDSGPTGCTSCRHNIFTFDSWGRKVRQQLANNPDGPVNVDTTYDYNGRISSESHPYLSGSSAVYEKLAYDGLDRKIATTHPDSQSVLKAYGAFVNDLGAVTSQQGATGTYGYGYPVIQMDEAGKQRQEWIDGFGKVIEVDEPGTSTATPGTTTVTVIGGGSSEAYMYDPCAQAEIGSCPYEVDNPGSITVTVNGFSAGVSYYPYIANPVTTQQIAADLAGALSVPGSPVTASANGSNIILTAGAAGSTTNYSFSSSEIYNNTQMCGNYPCFSGPAFVITPSSGALSGGTGGLSTSSLVTTYQYDAVGHLTQVVQGVQTRTFVYDGLGRVTSALLPEVTNTPSSGQPQQCAVSFTYDGNGNVLTKTAPAPNQKSCSTTVTTQYCYDALDRVTSKAYTAQSCPMSLPAVSYSYDQGGAAVYALGRRSGMTDSSGSEAYSYDAEGRITQVNKVVGSTAYPIVYQPNVAGQLKQITYPSGRVVAQTYDAVGRLTGVTSGGVNYTSGYKYDAAGHTTAFTYANGVAAAFAYSPDRSQLATLSYSNSTQTLLLLNYGYKNGQSNCGAGTTAGNDGLIQCIQDSTGTAQAGRSVVYTYDPLARITSAVTTGSTGYPKWGLSWSYDRYGNRLAQTITAGSSYSNSLTFATLPNGVGAYTNRPDGYPFDAAGNMLYDGINNLTYDVENRLTAASSGSSGGGYVYDNHGTRVEKCLPNCTSPTSTTQYVFSGSKDIAEYDNGVSPTSPSREYIYAGGQLTATITSASTIYHHADHLSVRITTDANGNNIGEQGHFPYGEQWYAANTTTKFFFTTYERNNESGLDYAMARFYINRFGRYCQMDPVGGSPLDPQSWNRYAYARNNPVNATDPSGTFWHWLMKAFMTWLSMGANLTMPGGGVPGDLPIPPSGTPPEVWDERMPVSTGSIPPGVIIDESGGFGQGFMGEPGTADPFGGGGDTDFSKLLAAAAALLNDKPCADFVNKAFKAAGSWNNKTDATTTADDLKAALPNTQVDTSLQDDPDYAHVSAQTGGGKTIYLGGAWSKDPDQPATLLGEGMHLKQFGNDNGGITDEDYDKALKIPYSAINGSIENGASKAFHDEMEKYCHSKKGA
jgi:RHS repeat-associated protein